jgi:hypothetical protein
VSRFFGLTPQDKEQLIYEPSFLLTYYGGHLWSEVYRMPIAEKRWYIDRIVKELNRTHEQGNTQSRALHQNAPDVRELQGMSRPQSPSRLRRFT